MDSHWDRQGVGWVGLCWRIFSTPNPTKRCAASRGSFLDSIRKITRESSTPSSGYGTPIILATGHHLASQKKCR